MSRLNIKGVIRNIGPKTTVYMPVIETVVNAIQAIKEKGKKNGKVRILVVRSRQEEMDKKDIPLIQSFIVEDNGIGFNDDNLQSFDTIYSEHKLKEGGKGFGRFVCLKYFENLKIESIYEHEGILKERKFRMGRGDQIIVDEPIRKNSIAGSTRTSVKLENLIKVNFPDREIKKIARMLVEELLSYFIDKEIICPEISVSEQDGTGEVILNEFIGKQSAALIEEIELDNHEFVLGENEAKKKFGIRLFKFYSAKQWKNMISLVAHGRQVTTTATKDYIPEFHEEFRGQKESNLDSRDLKFVVKSYVFGKYLNDNVSLERGDFDFSKDQPDLVHGISMKDIERRAAEISEIAVAEEIAVRKKEKEEMVRSYVDEEAPWLKQTSEKADLNLLSCNASEKAMLLYLYEKDCGQEIEFKTKFKGMMTKDNINDLEADIEDLTKSISLASTDALTHYLVRRGYILGILNKRLQCGSPKKKYPSEASLHNVIFPQGEDSDSVSYDEHNLWIIDERLNFTEYLSSDKPLGETKLIRPDIMAFPPPMIFSNGEGASHPVIIVEFKRPERDDFVDRSSKENPIEQIIRYVSEVRKEKTIRRGNGQKFPVDSNTPFYGYLVCSINKKIMGWLDREEFKPMADNENWFRWFDNNKLYMEVISWDKLLKNAEMRHDAFFKKLKIQAGLWSR